jgi:hypothetical protein
VIKIFLGSNNKNLNYGVIVNIILEKINDKSKVLGCTNLNVFKKILVFLKDQDFKEEYTKSWYKVSDQQGFRRP